MNKIYKFIRLTGIWIIKILFGHSHFKVPFSKRVYFAINGGFMPDQVALYNLNKKNRIYYLSEFDWYKSRYINGKYGFLLDNKLVCNDLLKQYIRVPKVFYIKQNGVINSYNSEPCDLDKVFKTLRNEESLYLKPFDVGKGTGVNRLDYKDNKYYIDFNEVTETSLKHILTDRSKWFVSECMKQSDILNKIYDKTTNTIRMITIRSKKDNSCKLIAAVQRIGTKETIPVDNGSRGGLVAKIDIETGELSSAKSIQKMCDYDLHPDSNNPIKGVKIPDWDKVKKEIVSLMEQIPYISFVAWDVLLTKDGPCIIEANSSSGVNIIQIYGGERQGQLGMFYKEHGIIK